MGESYDKESTIICQKEVELLNKRYLIYLKKVPTRIAVGGQILNTTVRAFIKEVK